MAAKTKKFGYLQLKAKDGRRYELELIIADECLEAAEGSSQGGIHDHQPPNSGNPQFQNFPPVEEPPNEPGKPPVKEPPPEDPDREPPQQPPGGPPVKEPPNEPGRTPVKEPPPEDPNREPPQKPPVRAATENRRRKSRSLRLIRSVFKPQSKNRFRRE